MSTIGTETEEQCEQQGWPFIWTDDEDELLLKVRVEYKIQCKVNIAKLNCIHVIRLEISPRNYRSDSISCSGYVEYLRGKTGSDRPSMRFQILCVFKHSHSGRRETLTLGLLIISRPQMLWENGKGEAIKLDCGVINTTSSGLNKVRLSIPEDTPLVNLPYLATNKRKLD